MYAGDGGLEVSLAVCRGEAWTTLCSCCSAIGVYELAVCAVNERIRCFDTDCIIIAYPYHPAPPAVATCMIPSSRRSCRSPFGTASSP